MAASRIQRWAIILSAYNYELIFKSGRKHGNADSMSRLPFQSDGCEECSMLENYVLITELCHSATTSEWGNRVVIPFQLRERVINKLPDCHPGILHKIPL